MRAVYVPKPGVIALNFMFLPTLIGMDNRMLKEMEKELAPKIQGRPLDEETLNFAHEQVIDFILRVYPHRPGLRDYIDALKFVED
jgi:hypothetical protein